MVKSFLFGTLGVIIRLKVFDQKTTYVACFWIELEIVHDIPMSINMSSNWEMVSSKEKRAQSEVMTFERKINLKKHIL